MSKGVDKLIEGNRKAADQHREAYAKEVAIGLLNFAVGEPYKYISGDYDGIASLDMPPEEIYNQYIQSLTK